MDAIGWEAARAAVRAVNPLIAAVAGYKGSHRAAEQEQEPDTRYTYRRGSDGVDDTWDIYDPFGKFV